MNARGYRELLQRSVRVRPARLAIEGSGSYGAGLARFLACREAVLEVSRTPRTERRLRGKDDALDAARTARAVLASEETLARPRAGEQREALRLLLVARRSAVDVRRETLTQLRAVITAPRAAPPRNWRELTLGKLLSVATARAAPAQPAPTNANTTVLRSLARRIQAATLEADELERELLADVRALAPALLDEPGIGPVVAAQLIVACLHHGRLRSEACFARLAGVAPTASSGQTQRHRLSRGGDRQLNRYFTIALHRRQHDQATKDYIARRISEGKSRRDATRLLKRYLARHLYRLLEQQPQEPLTRQVIGASIRGRWPSRLNRHRTATDRPTNVRHPSVEQAR